MNLNNSQFAYSIRLFVISLFGLLSCTTHLKQESVKIRLRDFSFDPIEFKKSHNYESASLFDRASQYRIIQFKRPLRSSEEGYLKDSLKIDLSKYVSKYGYICKVDKTSLQEIRALEYFRSDIQYQTKFKYSKTLLSKIRDKNFDREYKYNLVIELFPNVQRSEVVSRLSNKIAIESINNPRLIFASVNSLKEIEFVLNESSVLYINVPASLIAQNIPSSNFVRTGSRIFVPSPMAYGLTGMNEVLGHIDGGINSSHCALKSKNLGQMSPIGPIDFNNEHGTNTAISAIGRSYSGFSDQGIAHNAKYVHANFLDLRNGMVIDSVLSELNSLGAHVHNISYSHEGLGYSRFSSLVDEHLFKNEYDLVVCASNTRDPMSPRSLENSKSTIAVNAGLLNAFNELSYYSGNRENAIDGRIKPDLIAPGVSVTTGSGKKCRSVVREGTSIAAPFVSGSALLLREYFIDKMKIKPSGNLIKSCLIHGAERINTVQPWPNNEGFGWGHFVLKNIVEPSDSLLFNQVFRTNGLSNYHEENRHDYYVNVIDSNVPLTVTLVWNDKNYQPMESSVLPGLINDLDIEVEDPDMLIRSTTDTISPIEQLLVTNPQLGEYRVSIKEGIGEIEYGKQGYSVIISGGLSHSGQITIN